MTLFNNIGCLTMIRKNAANHLAKRAAARRHNFYGLLILAAVLPVCTLNDAFAERRVTTNEGNALSKTDSRRVQIPKDLKVPLEWQQLIDPTQDSFWVEGNFKPDQGFLLWAKNPTVDNAKLYLIRMNAKRDTLHIMQKQQELANKELISKGIIANDYDFLAGQTGRVASRSDSDDLRDFHIFFLFHPDCGHCKRQAQILSGKNNVTPLQVAGEKLVQLNGLPPSIWAEKSDVEKYAPNRSVPVLLIFSSENNKMVSVQGVHTIDEIKQIAQALRQKGEK